MRLSVYIENTKLELYQDEEVEIVNSVVDINDIGSNKNVYSRSFTVPASKENNAIFKHYYNADIDNGFDARLKIDGRIEIDNIPFRYGKIRLMNALVKRNKPVSYTITFFGNLVTIKDLVKKDELTNLDLSAYDHAYSPANVKTGLTSSLFSGDVVYNLLVKKQYYYNSDATDNTQEEGLANISYYGGADAGVVWSDLRPSLRLIRVIEAIENDYGITFSRDFFGSTEFEGLFIWLNPDTDGIIGESTRIDWDGGGNAWMDLATDVGTYTVVQSSTQSEVRFYFLRCTITPASGYESVPYTLRCYRDGELFAENEYIGTNTQDITLNSPEGEVTYEVYYEILPNGEFQFTGSLRQEYRNNISSIILLDVTTASADTISSQFPVSTNLPKMQIIDFLKGIFNAFKLVLIPQRDGSYYVNTLNNFYREGTIRDITKYVDFEQYRVERGTLLNTISFKFSEASTILAEQFEINTGEGYGDEEIILQDANGELIDGESLEIQLPFEQVVYERLTDQLDSVQTRVFYGAIIGRELDAVNPKAHIFYNVPITTGGKAIGFQTGVSKDLINTQINSPSHSNVLVDAGYAFIFGNEIHEFNGQVMVNNLYSNHWDNYISSIFDPKKRLFTFKAILPRGIMHNLALNDVIVIKGRAYRIEKYTNRLNARETEFILVNTFDNSVGGMQASVTNILTDYTAKDEVVTITGVSASATITKVDTGFGTAFFSVNPNTKKITISFLENTTGAERDGFIKVEEGGYSVGIYIRQTEGDYYPAYKFNDERNSMYL